MLKNEKGITMLALVITVILVCLLAAVTISFSLGEDGVFSKSRKLQLKYFFSISFISSKYLSM